MSKNDIGLVHIYTGEGEEKTFIPIGLGIRYAGLGKNVAMFDFLRNTPDGELNILDKVISDFKIFRNENFSKTFLLDMNESEAKNLQKAMLTLFDRALMYMKSQSCDMLILNNILTCVKYNIISENLLFSLIKNKPYNTELILTGIDATDKIKATADYISDTTYVKLPTNNGN